MAATRSSTGRRSTGPGIAARVVSGAFFVIVLCTGLFMLFLAGGTFLDADTTFREADQGEIIRGVLGLAFCVFSLIPAAIMLQPRRDLPATLQAAGTAAGPDVAQDQRPATNIPNALRGQTPPPDAVIVAEAPWSTRVLFVLLAAVGAGMISLGWNWNAVFPEAPNWARYLPIAIGTVFALPVLRPMNWRSRHMAFIATHEGIYVHRVNAVEGNPVSTPNTAWLFVPWANVTDIREIVTNFQGQRQRTSSIEFTFRVTPEEAHEWFPVLDAQADSDDRYRVVQLPILGWADLVPRLHQISGLAGRGRGD